MNETEINFTINSTIAKSFNQQGCLYIETTIDWDRFEKVATALVQRIDATVKNKECGADIHRWQLDFEGAALTLSYEDISESFWLELEPAQDQEVLDFIAILIEKNND